MKKLKSAAKSAKGNLRTIHWPTPKEAVIRTFQVLAFSIVAGTIIAVVDAAAGHAFGALINLIA